MILIIILAINWVTTTGSVTIIFLSFIFITTWRRTWTAWAYKFIDFIMLCFCICIIVIIIFFMCMWYSFSYFRLRGNIKMFPSLMLMMTFKALKSFYILIIKLAFMIRIESITYKRLLWKELLFIIRIVIRHTLFNSLNVVIYLI